MAHVFFLEESGRRRLWPSAGTTQPLPSVAGSFARTVRIITSCLACHVMFFVWRWLCVRWRHAMSMSCRRHCFCWLHGPSPTFCVACHQLSVIFYSWCWLYDLCCVEHCWTCRRIFSNFSSRHKHNSGVVCLFSRLFLMFGICLKVCVVFLLYFLAFNDWSR